MEIKKLTEHNERCPKKDAEMLLRVFPRSMKILLEEIKKGDDSNVRGRDLHVHSL